MARNCEQADQPVKSDTVNAKSELVIKARSNGNMDVPLLCRELEGLKN